MKVRINRWYQAVLTVLLSMLGFESCSTDDPGTEEYGTPFVNYIVKGTVTDEAGKPIPGIQITAPAPLYSSNGFNCTLSDASGNFEFGEFSLFGDGIITADDIDDADNGGEFKSDTLQITKLASQKIEDGQGWCAGKYKVDAKFKLQKK